MWFDLIEDAERQPNPFLEEAARELEEDRCQCRRPCRFNCPCHCHDRGRKP